MLADAGPLDCLREEFSLPEGLHYLNCAYNSPLSKRVEAAGVAGVQRKRDPSVIGPDDFFTESDRLRALFAELIGAADARSIAILPSVSYGVATAARNLRIEPSQNLVVLGEQFPSNVYSWRRLCVETGATLRTVAPPDLEGGRGEAWNSALLDAIDSSTAIVAVPHYHWSDGTRFDLASVGQKARQMGAALVVDGTQSVGAVPFDVAEVQPDALICAGYKTLFGPYSIGLAYYGSRFDDGVPLEENWAARRGSENFAGLVEYEDEFQEGAIRYDVGERSNWILVPMMIAALEQIGEWRPERISSYCAGLLGDLFSRVQEMGFQIEDDAWRGSHLFGLRPPAGTEPEPIRRALAEHRVSVSVRGRAIRVAPSVYNDADDIDALTRALAFARSGGSDS